MPLSALIYFYVRRLRTHPIQEALAGVGIATGVALVFAVQVANQSITAGTSQVLHSIVGAASLQLQARSAAGFDERLVNRVRELPGVQAAAPTLTLTAIARGPAGDAAVVQLASADPTLMNISGLARVASRASRQTETTNAPDVLVPRATAAALHLQAPVTDGIQRPLPAITLQLRGRSVLATTLAVFGPEDVGPLANAMAIITPLSSLQTLASLPHRITGILVKPAVGNKRRVEGELKMLAAGRLNVTSATQDLDLLRQATIPNDQATGFFGFVSALVGLLLAFNAMLLSTPERRRVIADLRIQGTRPVDLVRLLLFQALCLGVAASVAGILVGDVLSRGIFHETPGYLAAAFPLSTQTVVGWTPIVTALLGGVLATCLAACPPLLDLRRSRAVDAVNFEAGEPGQSISAATRKRLLLLATALLAVSIVAPLTLAAGAEIAAIVALALAALLAIPFIFTAVVSLADRLAVRAGRLNMLLLATRTLRATTARSLALAATGAIAVYGSVAANGAHNDLLHGLYRDYSQYVSTASMWIANPKDDLATNSFPASRVPARDLAAPGVAAVRPYQGGFIDLAGRRAWLIARDPQLTSPIAQSQLVNGSTDAADRRLRSGGWILASQQIAAATGTRVGGRINLPTPAGNITYRLAATTTNLGWSAGAIVLNRHDYAAAWQQDDPSALELDLTPGAHTEVVKRAIEATLGATSGLRVQTSTQRSLEADALAREGLDRLTQISLLLTVAAALAMAAAMGASMWQRRRSLASLRIQSFRPAQLRVILICESGLVLATGCLTGALAAVYGHALIDHYLRQVTGFPAPFSTAIPQGLEIFAVITGAALLVLLIPGIIASRVPPQLALQEHG
jgi:putative ABC transport system permease protein